MNVLVTAIGSMSSECVINSLNSLGIGVVGTDIYPQEYHPISHNCLAFRKVSRIYADSLKYCSELRDEALKRGCIAIVPLTDPEVDVISTNRDFFLNSGINIWLPDETVIKKVRNKELWCNLLYGSKSFKTIPSYNSFGALSREYTGDFVAKRITGRSSEGILFSNTSTFSSEKEYSLGYLFQPKIEGDIFTVDFAVHPKSGQMVFVPRIELMRTKNGAGTVVRIASLSFFYDAMVELVKRLKLTGVMNCEFISNKSGLYLMDINPRFSAGVSFSKKAGYDFVKANIDCYCSDSMDELNTPCTGSIFIKRFCDF